MNALLLSILLLAVVGCRPDPKFHNLIETPYATGGTNVWSATWALFFEDDPRSFPDLELPWRRFHPRDFTQDLAVVWLGHNSVLLKLGAHYVLTDPMFAERSSPYSFIGPKRFHPLPVNPQDLPVIDAVVVSHDHQDHFDESTVRALAPRVRGFYVPLEVGQYLREWGIPQEKIFELNWWETKTVGELKITCTPSRHISGRTLFANDLTLWASWAFEWRGRRIFFGGDTGFLPQFKEIGERLGPFELTLMPIGAYDEYWAGIHMTPEESLQAHALVRGQKFLPIHWGTFDLSRHAWDEPLLRLKRAAGDVPLVLPIPGEVINL